MDLPHPAHGDLPHATHGDLPHAPHGLPLSQVVARLGSAVAEIVTPGPDPVVDDVTLAEPEQSLGVAGDIVLGLGVGTSDSAVALVDKMAAKGVDALGLRRPVAFDPAVRDAAADARVALVAIADDVSWAHLAWLLREILDRSGVDPSTSQSTAGDDLFALADACTALLGAPVTVEDTRNRVVAYSELHDEADPVRVSTILGRRAPAATVAALRSRGVFRQLARSDEPLFLPPAPDGSLGGRHIIPTRVGEEWVGSIWAVVDEPLPAARIEQARDLVRLVALHLLRLRTESEVGRRLVDERVRAALEGESSASATLPEPPWRAVVLGTDPGTTAEAGLALWEAVLRRTSWRRPLLSTVDSQVVAIVTDPPPGTPPEPGTWASVRRVVTDVATRQPWAEAAAGPPATDVGDLARSLAGARDLVRLKASGAVTDVIVSGEGVWAELTVSRAVDSVAGSTASSDDPITAAGLDPALVETLRVWLDHPADPRACAEALHVHPNTVRYRMGRVRELLDVDLADPTVRLALALLTRIDRSA